MDLSSLKALQSTVLGEDMGAGEELERPEENSQIAWFNEQMGFQTESSAADTRAQDIAYDVWTKILQSLKAAGVPDAQAKQEAMKLSIQIKEPLKKILTTYANRS